MKRNCLSIKQQIQNILLIYLCVRYESNEKLDLMKAFDGRAEYFWIPGALLTRTKRAIFFLTLHLNS